MSSPTGREARPHIIQDALTASAPDLLFPTYTVRRTLGALATCTIKTDPPALAPTSPSLLPASLSRLLKHTFSADCSRAPLYPFTPSATPPSS